MDCHFLLQGIFLTQRSNPGFLHCRQTLYCLSHQGSQNNEVVLLFPSPVDHVLSELTTMIHPSWVNLHGMAYSFIELYKADNHDDVIINLEPDILECEVKWALGSITMNKASGGEEFQLSYFKTYKMML